MSSTRFISDVRMEVWSRRYSRVWRQLVSSGKGGALARLRRWQMHPVLCLHSFGILAGSYQIVAVAVTLIEQA